MSFYTQAILVTVCTYNSNSFGFVKTCFLVRYGDRGEAAWSPTGQVEKIGVLMEFIEHGTGSIFDLRSSKDRDPILGESRGKL